ncbi:PaaI family thioesterase [Effusibacillus dendaii]|uniref:Medium/long-chain acyl-CoA thioesterase YigI n=1 Tax=Effusibacillus dendaii TaxID=2743772 RepID=A0A7I8DAK9_9BACL|nr:PaaI family thioesterase [Effusibacillus dendaii]BCJ86392.1 hypothetical protein skT53_13770 [Effusibacillus dendaii]
MTQESYAAKIQSLAEQLAELDDQELDLVQHTIRAIRKSRTKDFHFYGNFLDIELPDRDDLEQVAKMRLGPHVENYFGVAQGGAVYTLADVSMGYLILSRLEPERRVATLELKMNYIRPGTGDALRCKSEILHWGRNTIVAECKIVNDQDQLVATALGTFFHQ